MELFLSANVHQGDELFDTQSRCKQCAFMILSAILMAKHIPLLEWSQSTFTNALVQGDKLYMKTLNSVLIVLDPRVELLSIDDLPRIINVSYSATTFCGEMRDTVITNYELPVAESLCSTSMIHSNGTLGPGEVEQDNTILSVMVAKNELPVMVANNELPVMVANT